MIDPWIGPFGWTYLHKDPILGYRIYNGRKIDVYVWIYALPTVGIVIQPLAINGILNWVAI